MDSDRIAGAADEMAGKVENAAGNIAGDARTQGAGAMREAAGTVQNLYGQAKDATRDAAGAAIDYARGPGSDALARTVRDNPVGSLVMAAFAGFALALLMRPKPRPQRRWRDD
jgi:uncharacterized protein YjbJ (UPF0337 family)